MPALTLASMGSSRSSASDLYLENPDVIRRYNLLFDHLRAKALDPAHSAEFFARVAKELS